MKLSLRDLFWLVLLAALTCATAVYSKETMTLAVLGTTIQLAMLIAIGVIVGRYVTKAPFAAGFLGGLSAVLLFNQDTPFSYLLERWGVLPRSPSEGLYNITMVMTQASSLLSGVLSGWVALVIARDSPRG